MVTMNDIAKKVGISRPAVSSVLNNPDKSRVSAEVKKKILQLAEEMNYIPNTTARILKGGVSQNIGLVGSTNIFGVRSAFISCLDKQLRQNNYDLIISNSLYEGHNRSTKVLIDGVRKLEMKGIDGIIFLDTTKDLLANYTPKVPYLSYSSDDIMGSDIEVDKEYGAYIATKHLIEHGHKNIACLCVHNEHTQNKRIKGWQKACEENNCYNPENYIIANKFNGEIDALINTLKKQKITAIFASNDYIAARLVNVLFTYGLKVPDDMAIIGYDGQSFCEFCLTPLATVIQPLELLAKRGVDILLNRIKNNIIPTELEKILVKPILHTSRSCGCKSSVINKFYIENTYSTLEMDYKMNFNIDILKK